ncbi:hypothetical protein E2C01_039404 [Portunus trituberculatus]|uniref:Uncharacterized protein n=1 Tax=Portunus trituberculatus TaxID=210409 RepID=A0A5B7FLA1_PORTR|nr:hypothetical protein [Portunus trituberculatus]
MDRQRRHDAVDGRRWLRQCVNDIGKYSFPHRTVEKWNALDNGIVIAHSVHNFKDKLDKWRKGDRTL